MQNTIDVTKLIAEIREFMAATSQLLEEGSNVDVTGLDDKVAALCKAVLAMPTEESDRYEQELDMLRQDLARLGENLTETKDIVEQDIQTLNAQKQASAAYQASSYRSGEAPDPGPSMRTTTKQE